MAQVCGSWVLAKSCWQLTTLTSQCHRLDVCLPCLPGQAWCMSSRRRVSSQWQVGRGWLTLWLAKFTYQCHRLDICLPCLPGLLHAKFVAGRQRFWSM